MIAFLVCGIILILAGGGMLWWCIRQIKIALKVSDYSSIFLGICGVFASVAAFFFGLYMVARVLMPGFAV